MALTINPGTVINPGVSLYGYRTDLIFYINANDTRSYPGTGTTWYDLSGQGHTVTLHNGASFDTDGISFDYTQQQYADFPPATMFTNNDMTAISWVYIRSFPSWSRIFDFGNGPNSNDVLLTPTTGGNGYPAYSTTGADNIYSSQPLTPNQWVQLVAVQSGSTGLIYINGQQVASAANAGIANVTRTNNYIGRSNWGSDSYLDGKIASLKIYNRALTSGEILDDFNTNNPSFVTNGLYANYDARAITNTATFPDSSGNSRNATLFDNPTTTIFNGTPVLQLNGSSQYFAKTDGYGSDLDSAFTFDVWACPVSAGTPGVLIAEWSPNVGGGWQDTQMGFTNVDIRAGVYNTGGAIAKNTWTANTWYHIVTTYDGSMLRTYVNNVAGGTTTGAKQSPTVAYNGPTVLSMGIPCADYLGGTSGYFHGFIGAWKIYNRALTPTEVTQNFTALRGRYGV